MSGSTVSVFNVNSSTGSDTGSAITTTTTNASGAYKLTLAPPPTGPVRISVAGGSYQSEEDSATISAPAAITVLLSSLPQGVQGVDINPLTYFIDLQATADIQKNSTPIVTALSNATSNIESIYALATNPNTLVPDFTNTGIGTDAGKLGLVLGGLINEDQILCPSSPGGLVTALASDISDKVFDGKVFGVSVSYCGSGTLSAIAGTSDFMDALSAIQESTLVPRTFVFGGTGNVLTNNGVMPSSLVGTLSEINSKVPTLAPAVTNSLAAGPTMGAGEDRQGATATLLGNGLVLIAGGDSTSTGLRNDAVLYNPGSNTFSTVTSTMAFPREFATATLLPNGKVLIAGGFSTSIVTNTTSIFDPSNNTFSAGPVLSTGRENAAAMLLANGTVMIAGGDSSNNTAALATTDIYTPNSGTMSAGPSMNHARTSLMATILPNGNALVVGGDNSGNSDNTAEIYNAGTNSFSITTITNTMNTAREQGTATLLPSGNVLIAGGFNIVTITGPTITPLKSTELLLTTSNAFQSARAVNMNTARANMTATLVPNGSVIIAGGDQTTGGSGLGSIELYNSLNDVFQASPPPMTSTRAVPTETLLPNGKVLIAGGLGNGATTNTTDLYTP